MTGRLATVDTPAPCGTPARLRWHLAHGQRCQVCEALPDLPPAVHCHQCGTADRPGVLAYFKWLEAANQRLTDEVTAERARAGANVEAERARTAAVTAKLAAARAAAAQARSKARSASESTDQHLRALRAAREGLELLLRQPVIRHEAVARLLNLIDN